MNNIDAGKILQVLLKEKKTILTITTLFILIGVIVAFITPKTYTSSAVIQLSRFENKPVYRNIEAKNIMESSVVLEPVARKYSLEKQLTVEDLKKRLKVEIPTEEFNYQKIMDAHQIAAAFTANNPAVARDMLSDIVSGFIDYMNVKLEVLTKPALIEYNETIRLAGLEYNNTLQQIEKSISEKEQAIADMEADSTKLERQINELKAGSLSTEAIAKTMLLASMENGLKERLLSARENKTGLENNRIQAETNYTEKIVKAKIRLEHKLSTVEEFKVINEPQVPGKYIFRNLALAIAASIIIGLATSFTLVFVKNRDKILAKKD